ncbi:replication-associated recombination protein A [Alteromonas sediminis]|uniref:Replication-associated recombination protein A n=1 Tax=Alteromonas sediminis TaxID=2259342 RepID=A0A3N5YNX7_9ALTE|nr:replication-associated recombination protein A [Alteromonas sediminis]RPJ67441.1 replication-associated recombination protein A [Alteromonas sediminis]
MRPTSLSDYIGQEHLLAPDKPLHKMMIAGDCHSMILWGPPGTGKTTLASLICQYAKASMITLSAVTSGVKDIRAAIEQAQASRQVQTRTLLFVDEVHRFNKSQQDAFLPFVEDGTVTFIGATTENPSFSLNKALLSRARVYVLQSLQAPHIEALVKHALTHDADLAEKSIELGPNTINVLVKTAAGDARRALMTLELACDLVAPGQTLLPAHIVEASGEKIAAYDNHGDEFYDLISAFHKSVRGSDPDAALFWYARILEGGGDPLYVARRLLAIVSEDIGNADPNAMQIALNAWDIFHRVGPAEGERAIAQATVYCSLAPKSNAVYRAFAMAKQAAKNFSDSPVPNHLRNAPTKLMKQLQIGKDYRYAHNEPGAYAAGEHYLPDEVILEPMYVPNERGFEKKLKEKLAYLRELDRQAENKT